MVGNFESHACLYAIRAKYTQQYWLWFSFNKLRLHLSFFGNDMFNSYHQCFNVELKICCRKICTFSFHKAFQAVTRLLACFKVQEDNFLFVQSVFKITLVCWPLMFKFLHCDINVKNNLNLIYCPALILLLRVCIKSWRNCPVGELCWFLLTFCSCVNTLIKSAPNI